MICFLPLLSLINQPSSSPHGEERVWSLRADGADLGHACFSLDINRGLQGSQLLATASATLWAGLGSSFGWWLDWVHLVYVEKLKWLRYQIVVLMVENLELGTRPLLSQG